MGLTDAQTSVLSPAWVKPNVAHFVPTCNEVEDRPPVVDVHCRGSMLVRADHHHVTSKPSEQHHVTKAGVGIHPLMPAVGDVPPCPQCVTDVIDQFMHHVLAQSTESTKYDHPEHPERSRDAETQETHTVHDDHLTWHGIVLEGSEDPVSVVLELVIVDDIVTITVASVSDSVSA